MIIKVYTFKNKDVGVETLKEQAYADGVFVCMEKKCGWKAE